MGESRKKPVRPGGAAKRRKTSKRGILDFFDRNLRSFANRSAALTFVFALLLLFDLFLMAAVFTDWTGLPGGAAAERIIGLFGGGILVILLYLGYVFLSALVRRGIPRFAARTVGTASLYVCAALLLGLLDLSRAGAQPSAFQRPGEIGRFLSEWLFRSVGSLGTTMAGVFTIILTLLCYGFNDPFIAAYDALRNLSLRLSEWLAQRRASSAAAHGAPRNLFPRLSEWLAQIHTLLIAAYSALRNLLSRLSEWLVQRRAPSVTAYGAPRNLFSRLSAWLAEIHTLLIAAYSATRSLFPRLSEWQAARRAALRRDETAVGGELSAPDSGHPDGNRAGELKSARGSAEDAADWREKTPEISLLSGVVIADRVKHAFLPARQLPPPPEIFGAEHDYDDDISPETARPWGERVIESLSRFGIDAELVDILLGPTVIQFRIQPLPGVKIGRIASSSNNLAMALAVANLRVEAPIPGHPYAGIEIPNPKRRVIPLRSIIEEIEFQFTDKTLPLPMGVTINGDPLVVGLEEMPHLLVAGATGSGKSVFVNDCIVGLCSMRKPDELKMVLVDSKQVEMSAYERLPHLLIPPVTNLKKAVRVLAWAVKEMERRYTLCTSIKVRNLDFFNESAFSKDKLPHIVIVINELADLMMTALKDVEEYICKLAQMAGMVGIHLVLATRRPSVNVITGLIKSNVPARAAFTLPSVIDSRAVLDCGGAEKLLGKGDMFFMSTRNPKPLRVQSPWIDEQSISRWIDYLVNMFGRPVYADIGDQGGAPLGFEESGYFSDAMLDEAVRVVISSGIASASGLQKRLRIGYPRAGRLVDIMETAGIIGPSDGTRAREVLVGERDAVKILERLRGGD
jgi:hypothetical protein